MNKPAQLKLIELPARPRIARAHVTNAGNGPGPGHWAEFTCARCGWQSEWMQISGVTEGKRGIPCPQCNTTTHSADTPVTPAMMKAALEGLNVDATPEGIMRSEREGQQALVASTDMPKEMRPSREAFEKVGFVFGEDVDELFVRAKLPPGWTRAGTSHAMHSDIIDEQGRKRVGVFYKAAFYDRRANAGLITRYQARWLFPSEENSGLQKDQRAWIVTDADREIFRTEPFKNDDYPADDAAKAVAHAWLNERFPDASDPTAYW